MRFSAAVVALLSAGLTRGLSIFRADQGTTLDDIVDVPGNSPLKFCDKPHDEDIVTIEKVDLLPNPPSVRPPNSPTKSHPNSLTKLCRGAALRIEAAGTVYETIEKGAYIQLQVKYGLIRLVNTKADLCEQVENVDLECPIEKGVVTITKDIDLPREIPPVSRPAYGVDVMSC
jgi:hypothetical protein